MEETKTDRPDGFDSEVRASLYHLTDIGNGQRLALRHGDKLRHLWDEDKWLFFDGHRWSIEAGRENLRRLVKETSLAIYAEAKIQSNEHERKRTAQWAVKTEAEFRGASMANMAKSEKPISTYSKYFDTDPMQFNSKNWVVDLTTGGITPQQPEQNITKLGGCEFDEAAVCPVWERCVCEWMEYDDAKILYLQTILGYCLTGDVSARLFPIFWGPGFNGKSKCLEAVSEILGDYATIGSEDLLSEKKMPQHPTDIMKLKGRRLVLVDETKRNMKLRTSLIKRMTGDSILTGRLMRHDFEDFTISHKLILMTQNLPWIDETSDGIWDRVHLLKWGRQFAGDERDPDLANKLRNEYPGILNWLIQGCLNWQAAGRKITRPESVQQAGLEYRSESDPLGDFMTSECELNPNATTTVKAVKECYHRWCAKENIKYEIGSRNFNQYLRERGCIDKPARLSGNLHKCWVGLGLRENFDD